MANALDYIAWRGDLSFSVSPFNEVDNLIFAMLSYINMMEIVPPCGNRNTISLRAAAEKYAAKHGDDEPDLGLLVPDRVPQMLKMMAQCARYRSVRLSDYVNHIDAKLEEQFSALTIDLLDGTHYISFCGTDDTIVGWKENFNMSFSDSVPAQREALHYLENIAAVRVGALRVGGHSKGGNLAVYSAMHSAAELKNRIIQIYNNDGPGFKQSVINLPEYTEIRGRVQTILPQSSFVGMLMEHEEEYEVVQSDGVGALQHDGFTWKVLGTEFLDAESTTEHSKYMDQTIKKWVEDIDMEHRKEFIDAVFTIMMASGETTLSGLREDGVKNAGAMIDTLRGFDKETRGMIYKTVLALIKAGLRVPELPEIPKVELPRVSLPKIGGLLHKNSEDMRSEDGQKQ